MDEINEIKNFRSIKYFEEELLDIYNYISEFIKAHNEKEINTYYESVICHKIDRLCFGIPNFILSDEIFKMIKDIFLKLINIKQDKDVKNVQKNIINEMYLKFKYLLEWCILYFEETYLDN